MLYRFADIDLLTEPTISRYFGCDPLLNLTRLASVMHLAQEFVCLCFFGVFRVAITLSALACRT